MYLIRPKAPQPIHDPHDFVRDHLKAGDLLPIFATHLDILAQRIRTNQLTPSEIEREVMDCFQIVVEIERQGRVVTRDSDGA